MNDDKPHIKGQLIVPLVIKRVTQEVIDYRQDRQTDQTDKKLYFVIRDYFVVVAGCNCFIDYVSVVIQLCFEPVTGD